MAKDFVEPSLIEKIACKTSFEISRATTVLFGLGTAGCVVNSFLNEGPWYWKAAAITTGFVGTIVNGGYQIYWEEDARYQGINISRWPREGWRLPGAWPVKSKTISEDNE